MIGLHAKGAILALPDLATPSYDELRRFYTALREAGYGHVVLAVKAKAQGLGHKVLVLPNETRDEAISIARKHCQNCETVVVFGSLEIPAEPMMERLQPEPFTAWAPTRNVPGGKAWEGSAEKKPWEYGYEVHIPVLDPGSHLATVLALWRAQTVRPYIVLTDTGSLPENYAKLEALRAPDLEVHSLRMGGNVHPSDPVAVACDLAFAMCRTEKIVMTHDDVFLRCKDSAEQLLAMCDADNPAVGFRMTPRDHPIWKDTVAHSFAAFCMPTMRLLGVTWSLRRVAELFDTEHSQKSKLGNALDTETCLSMVLTGFGFDRRFIGDEANFEQTIHPLARHLRTMAGAKLYSPAHYAKTQEWLKDAMAEANSNLEAWKE